MNEKMRANSTYVESVLKRLFGKKAMAVLGESDYDESFFKLVLESILPLSDKYISLEDIRINAPGISFGEFMAVFNMYLLQFRNDPNMGDDEIARMGLPIDVLFKRLLQSEKKNSELKTFFDLEINRVYDYLDTSGDVPCDGDRFSLLPIDARKKEKIKVRELFELLLNNIHKYWTPGEDINEYMLKINRAIYDFYICGYLLLLEISACEDIFVG